MNNDIEEQINSLDKVEKELRRMFKFVAWELVRAETPEQERELLAKLRSVATDISKPESERESLEAELIRRRHEEKATQKAVRYELSAESRAKAEATAREQAEIKAARLAKIAAQKAAFIAKKEAAQAQAETAKYHQLAAEEKRQAIIMQAISTGRLTEVVESREEKIVNDARRSGGGIVRIESGDGK